MNHCIRACNVLVLVPRLTQPAAVLDLVVVPDDDLAFIVMKNGPRTDCRWRAMLLGTFSWSATAMHRGGCAFCYPEFKLMTSDSTLSLCTCIESLTWTFPCEIWLQIITAAMHALTMS